MLMYTREQVSLTKAVTHNPLWQTKNVPKNNYMSHIPISGKLDILVFLVALHINKTVFFG